MNCKRYLCKKPAIQKKYITTVGGKQFVFSKSDQLCLDHCAKEARKRANAQKNM